MPTALRPLFEPSAGETEIHGGISVSAVTALAAVLHQNQETHLCFHCLRVTYVNRLRRAGVPREAAMRLVNHASELIHQIYQREKVEDVAQWRDAVQFTN
jgi:integrase